MSSRQLDIYNKDKIYNQIRIGERERTPGLTNEQYLMEKIDFVVKSTRLRRRTS